MARVTVEDCVLKVPNRFELVLLAAQRAREMTSGAPLSLERDNDKNPVVALREIADETVGARPFAESVVRGMQKHVEIDEPEETHELEVDPTMFGVGGPGQRCCRAARVRDSRTPGRGRRRARRRKLTDRAEEEGARRRARWSTSSGRGRCDRHRWSADDASPGDSGPRMSERGERHRPGDGKRRLTGGACMPRGAPPLRIAAPRSTGWRYGGVPAHDAAIRAGRARQGLRSARRRGRAQPRLCLLDEGARRAAARLGRPLFLASGRGRRHPRPDEARQRLDRHRAAARHGRGHGGDARATSSACSAPRSPGWSTASPSCRASSCNRTRPSRPRISASWCWRCRRTSACCWSSSPTACTTCARCISSRSDEAPPPHRARDDGDLRAAGRAHRHARDEGRARGPRLRRAPSRGARQHHGAARLPARARAATWSRASSPSCSETLARRRARRPRSRAARRSPYSIWRKMQRKNVAFEQLSDIMAFRVVVDDVERVLSRARRDP